MKLIKKVILVLLICIFTSTNAYAIDKNLIKIDIGGLALDAKKDNDIYVTTSFRTTKETLTLSTSEEGVEIIGAGTYDMPNNTLDIPFSFKKDNEVLEYNLHISKRKTPAEPIDFSLIDLYIDGKKYDVKYGFNLIIKVAMNRTRSYIDIKSRQEGLEIIGNSGYIDLNENEVEVPFTFKTKDDKHEYKISFVKKDTIKDKDNKATNIGIYVYVVFIILIIVLLILSLILTEVVVKRKRLGLFGKITNVVVKIFLGISLLIFMIFTLLDVVFDMITINQVDGHSMDNTMHTGQVIIEYNKCNKYKYGDIVSARVRMYNNDKVLIICKRVIGVPGDEVEIKDNVLYINGKEIKEDYIKEKMNTPDLKIKLKDDEYFLMGDNRNISLDSRVQGPIKAKYIKSKIIYKFK